MQSRVNIDNLRSTVFNLEEENKYFQVRINEVEAQKNKGQEEELHRLESHVQQIENSNQDLHKKINEL